MLLDPDSLLSADIVKRSLENLKLKEGDQLRILTSVFSYRKAYQRTLDALRADEVTQTSTAVAPSSVSQLHQEVPNQVDEVDVFIRYPHWFRRS